MLIAYHVIISMDFVLINNHLNLIGPANIPAWATNCWQQLPDIPFPPTESLVHETKCKDNFPDSF